MDADVVKRALADITAEPDPTLKSAKMASLCSALFLEHGIELVVVSGSGIELLTDGAYTSGDLDFCHTVGSSISPRLRHEIMGMLGGTGGCATGWWPACTWTFSDVRKVLPAPRGAF